MGSVRWRTAIGRPLFFFSQEITIRLIKKDKGVMEDKKLTMPTDRAARTDRAAADDGTHFDIIRDKSIAAVEQAMVGDQRVFLATQKQPDEVIPDIDGICSGRNDWLRETACQDARRHGARHWWKGRREPSFLEMEKGGAMLHCDRGDSRIRSRTIWSTIQKEAMLRILKEQAGRIRKIKCGSVDVKY